MTQTSCTKAYYGVPFVKATYNTMPIIPIGHEYAHVPWFLNCILHKFPDSSKTIPSRLNRKIFMDKIHKHEQTWIIFRMHQKVLGKHN